MSTIATVECSRLSVPLHTPLHTPLVAALRRTTGVDTVVAGSFGARAAVDVALHDRSPVLGGLPYDGATVVLLSKDGAGIEGLGR